ncbi:MAG: hypothetical protein R6T91_00825 [Bacteroidales bacterium]
MMNRKPMLCKKWMISFCLLAALVAKGYAQKANGCDQLIAFGRHLYETENYQDLLQLKQSCQSNWDKHSGRDTLNFFVGSACLKLERADQAMANFEQITTVNKFKMRGIRLGLNYYLKTGDIQKSINWIEDRQDSVLRFRDIAFYHTGLYLIQNNLDGFDSLIQTTQLKEPQKLQLLEYRKQYSLAEKKSPFLAGVFSAALPGLGKVYAGKPHQGLSAFFTFGVFALQAGEAYYRNGLDSPVFYLTATLALAYYISDIWGSALAVKIYQQEQRHEINQDLQHQLYFAL